MGVEKISIKVLEHGSPGPKFVENLHTQGCVL